MTRLTEDNGAREENALRVILLNIRAIRVVRGSASALLMMNG